MSHPANSPTVWLDFSLKKIQSVRLAQALMESGFQIHLNEDTHGQFAHLRRFFDFRYTVGRGDAPQLPGIELNHTAPLTKIGTLERPLVFPHAILNRCRAEWPAPPREVRFFFAGLVTGKRGRTLRAWAETAGLKIRIPRREGALAKWFRRRILRTAPPAITKVESGDVVFWSSARGREYPVKAWDDDYYQAMKRAQFVLCPSGDSVWTYRFFEAAMCGAIPVVEAACPAYAGFQFFTMQQPLAELQWTQEIAEHNFRLCQERLTIPRALLDQEISRLLET